MSPRTLRRWIMVLVLVQVLVLVLMPLRAGPRMPSGTIVVLRADAGEHPDSRFKDIPAEELWLDYRLDELDVPDELDPGDVAYVELRAGDGPDEPMRPTRVLADEDELDGVKRWIMLWVGGDGEVDAGPIEVWFDADRNEVDALREHARGGGEFDVRIRLDPDGGPQVDDVTPVR